MCKTVFSVVSDAPSDADIARAVIEEVAVDPDETEVAFLGLSGTGPTEWEAFMVSRANEPFCGADCLFVEDSAAGRQFVKWLREVEDAHDDAAVPVRRHRIVMVGGPGLTTAAALAARASEAVVRGEGLGVTRDKVVAEMRRYGRYKQQLKEELRDAD